MYDNSGALPDYSQVAFFLHNLCIILNYAQIMHKLCNLEAFYNFRLRLDMMCDSVVFGMACTAGGMEVTCFFSLR